MDSTPHHDDGSHDDGPDAVEHLTPSVCWELLRGASVGRVAVVTDGAPDIFPVNHVVDHGTVVYRTNAGGLLTSTLRCEVAFEVDGLDVDGGEVAEGGAAIAWSVVLRGEASEGHRIEELLSDAALPLAPWQRGAKPRFVRITPHTITGRRFRIISPIAASSAKE